MAAPVMAAVRDCVEQRIAPRIQRRHVAVARRNTGRRYMTTSRQAQVLLLQ
jgi:hypothetical protein